MKKPIPKDKLILFGVPVAGLLLGLIGYLALVAPQKSAGGRLDSELQAVQTQIVAAQSAAHAKPAKTNPAQATDLFRLTKAMPDSDDMPGILRHLSRIARTSSVTLESVSPTVRIPLTQGYGALPLSIIVKGRFGEVSTFLRQLREQVSVGKNGRLRVDGRLFVANQLQITSDGRVLTATLKLDAFVYGVAPPAPPASPTAASTTGANST